MVVDPTNIINVLYPQL